MQNLLYKIIASSILSEENSSVDLSLRAIILALSNYQKKHQETQLPNINTIKTWLRENQKTEKTLEIAVQELTAASDSSVELAETETRRAERLRLFSERKRNAELLREQRTKKAEEKAESLEKYRTLEDRPMLDSEDRFDQGGVSVSVDNTLLIRFFSKKLSDLEPYQILATVDSIEEIPVLPSQRLELLKTPALLNAILEKLNPYEELSFTSKLLVGSFKWRMPGQNDFIGELGLLHNS